MQGVPDATLAAIGRLTVAATDLEYLLSWIGSDQAGGDATKIFTKPGEPLRAARGSVEFAPTRYRDAYLRAVSDAGNLLAEGQAAVRRMWTDSDAHDTTDWAVLQQVTSIQRLVDPAVLDRLAVRLMDCRAHLNALLEAQLRSQPPPH